MSLKDNIQTIKSRAAEFFSSSRGRDVLLYLVFVIISFVFWSILVLNNQMQQNYNVRIDIVNVPEGTTLIDECPDAVHVTLKNTGYAMMRYLWGEGPTLKISFAEYSDGKSRFVVTAQQMTELLSDLFGMEANVVNYSPESIVLRYTNRPGKKIPVVADADLSANFQYVLNGKVVLGPDSVVVYSDMLTLESINSVSTERFVAKELKDTLRTKLALSRLEGVRFIPDSISIMAPVEPLVQKLSLVQVVPINVPEGMRLITFPSLVKASYFIPISCYDSVNKYKLTATVDYSDIHVGQRTLPLRIDRAPDIMRNVTLTTDSVEFIVERL